MIQIKEETWGLLCMYNNIVNVFYICCLIDIFNPKANDRMLDKNHQMKSNKNLKLRK